MSYREALKAALWIRVNELLELRKSRKLQTANDNVICLFKSLGWVNVVRFALDDFRRIETREKWVEVPAEAFHLKPHKDDVATMTAIAKVKISEAGVAEFEASFDWGQLNEFPELANSGLIFADADKLLDLLYELGTTEPQPEPA